MTTKQLSIKAPVGLAIALGATSPDPGTPGCVVWSTTTSSLLHWSGTSWQNLRVGPIGAITATGASVTVDVTGVELFRLTMQANVTTLTLTGAVDGQKITLEVIQDATGSRTLAWPANVRFGTDITSFTLTTTASKKDRIGLIYDAGASKYDFVAGVHSF